jgi:nitric oxide reductase activation protein
MSYANTTPSSSKASTALKMAVLMAEALKQVPGVELEVYSFTSCGSRDTLFKYLYGGNNPKLEGLANYGSGSQNYDYQAIQVAAEQFKKYTTNENRLMIVLSDGAPCGHFRGLTAFEATKMSVDTVRRQGIKVLQVAIEDYQGSSSIYGNKWVIKFTDIPQLVNEMRKMIVRVVRDATEGR